MAALRALILTLRRAFPRPEAPAAIDLDAKREERRRQNPGTAELPLSQYEAELATGELSPEALEANARLARLATRYAPAARRELAARRHAQRQPRPVAPTPERTAPRARPRERRATAGRRAAARSPGSSRADDDPPSDLAVIPIAAFRAELERALGGGRP